MRMKVNHVFAVMAFVLAAFTSVVARTTEVTITRNQIIPVVIEDQLTLKDTRAGDRFTAKVTDSRDLPYGTRLLGKVTRVRQPKGSDQGFMDLEFTELIVPGGENLRISGVPVPLNDKGVRKDRDGRFYVSEDYRKRQGYVIGGAAGGFIIGSLVKKQLEGAIIGTIGGIIAAETDKSAKNGPSIKSGMAVGALLDRDIKVRFDKPIRDERMVVKFGDREARFDGQDQAYYEGAEMMLSVTIASDQLGLKFDKGESGTIYLEGKDCDMKLTPGSNEVRINGRTTTSEERIAEKRGTVFVPARLIARMLGVEFSVVRD